MVDELIRALVGERRRYVLRRLRSERPAAVVETGELTMDGGKAERIRLEHSLLPVLVKADLVRWDRERDLVERGPAFDAALPFLDLIERERSGTDTCSDVPA